MPTIWPKKKRKPKKVQPDEVFRLGPIQMARYGRVIVSRNLAGPEGTEQIRARVAEAVPKLRQDISEAIAELLSTLSSLDPRFFLQQAYGEYFMAHLGVEDEPSMTFEEHGLAARMVDYCQSIFAALEPPREWRKHTQEEFDNAKRLVEAIFQATRQLVFFSHRGEENAVDNEDQDALGRLITKLLYHWIFVRSDRHSFFEIPHHRDLILPLDPVLVRALGISANDLMAGLERLHANAHSGLGDAIEQIRFVHNTAGEHPEFERLIECREQDRVAELARLSGVAEGDITAALETFLGTRLFEIETHSRWPASLIEALSYSPGEARDFLVPDGTAAWPTRIWPIFQRPFLRIDGRSYCFDYIAFFDRFYRHLVKLLRRIDPSAEDAIRKLQSQTVERLTQSMLERLLPGSS